MDQKKTLLTLCLVLILCVFSPACKKKTQPETAPDPTAGTQVQTPEPEPETAPPVQVERFEEPEPDTRPMDESAAILNERGVLKTIYFGYDKSELTDTARAILRENSNWLKANPQWNVVIEGHCDERGTIEYNLALGQRRANSVREHLIGLGVSAERLQSIGFGESKPIASNRTARGREANRRVEFRIMD